MVSDAHFSPTFAVRGKVLDPQDTGSLKLLSHPWGALFHIQVQALLLSQVFKGVTANWAAEFS